MSDEPTDLLSLDPESAPPPARVIIGYYECMEPISGIAAGQYVRVTHLDVRTGRVHFVRRYGKRDLPRHDFLMHFEYAPDGERLFNEHLDALTRRVTALGNEIVDLQESLSSITIHADQTGVAGLEEVKDLVPVQDRSLAGARQTLAGVVSLAHTKREELQKAQEELKAMLAERQAAFEALVKPLEDLVARMKEGIWTLRLYFGDEMEVVQIRDGEPAPSNTPITIRQLVLAMDEECAITSDGGIDARSIEQFDEWLLEDQAHVDQVIPEKKAIVAVVPRWNPKDYRDPWLTAQVAGENKQTWLIIRNGLKLFRLAPEMLVGKSLLPRRDEFTDLFYETRYNGTTRQHERVPMEPGSRAFMEAEKQADDRRRHYMRIAMVIQGILDHHTILQPLAEPISVTRPDSFERGLIRLVEDGELVFGDGRERFVEWQQRLNAELDVGMRIIGDFHSYEGFGGMSRDGRHPRLSPDSADRPPSNILHTLEGKRDGGFSFLYDRTERWQRFERRASCVVMPEDDFILPFDLITIPEIDYYLASRLDRKDYLAMFPVLKAARRAKLEEQQAEAPFRDLLAWEIAKRYGVEVEAAAQDVPDLINWFKFKVRRHRPLVGNDEGKAMRMIVDAYASVQRERENRAKRQANGEFARLLAQAEAEFPDLLLFAHRAEAEYVALVPHNDESVYVREVVMSPRGRREEQPWRIVDGRIKRWHILFTSARWEGWTLNPSRSEHLTDPEIEAQTEAVRQQVTATVAHGQRHSPPEERTPLVVLAITFDRGARLFHLYGRTEPLIEPSPFVLAERAKELHIAAFTAHWRRNPQREVVIDAVGNGSSLEWPCDARPWDAGQYRQGRDGGRYKQSRPEVILFIDDEAISHVQANAQARAAAIVQTSTLSAEVRRMEHHLADQWEAERWARLRDAFMADYGRTPNAEDLWTNHKKGLKNPPIFPFHQNVMLTLILSYFVERGVSVEGLTWAEVVRRYRAERPEGTDAECIKPFDSFSRSREDRQLPTGLDEFTL